MANDREVLREIWDGKIPVCFTLDTEETCELQGPDPFYLMVPRLSYFPVCTEKVLKFVIFFLCFKNILIYQCYCRHCLGCTGEKTFYKTYRKR